MERMVMLRRPVAITVSMPATEQSRCPMHEMRDDHVFVGWLVWWLWKKTTHLTRQGPTIYARLVSGYGIVQMRGYVGRRRFGNGNEKRYPNRNERWMWMYGNASGWCSCVTDDDDGGVVHSSVPVPAPPTRPTRPTTLAVHAVGHGNRFYGDGDGDGHDVWTR